MDTVVVGWTLSTTQQLQHPNHITHVEYSRTGTTSNGEGLYSIRVLVRDSDEGEAHLAEYATETQLQEFLAWYTDGCTTDNTAHNPKPDIDGDDDEAGVEDPDQGGPSEPREGKAEEQDVGVPNGQVSASTQTQDPGGAVEDTGDGGQVHLRVREALGPVAPIEVPNDSEADRRDGYLPPFKFVSRDKIRVLRVLRHVASIIRCGFLPGQRDRRTINLAVNYVYNDVMGVLEDVLPKEFEMVSELRSEYSFES